MPGAVRRGRFLGRALHRRRYRKHQVGIVGVHHLHLDVQTGVTAPNIPITKTTGTFPTDVKSPGHIARRRFPLSPRHKEESKAAGTWLSPETFREWLYLSRYQASARLGFAVFTLLNHKSIFHGQKY